MISPKHRLLILLSELLAHRTVGNCKGHLARAQQATACAVGDFLKLGHLQSGQCVIKNASLISLRVFFSLISRTSP